MDTKILAVLEMYHERIEQEKIDRQERPAIRDPLSRDQLMRAVGPSTGQLLNTLVKSLSAPLILELGTSFGYSGIWLAEAARTVGGRIITSEMYDYKSDYAREMAAEAGLAQQIDFRVGDALKLIDSLNEGVDFVLLDIWKDLYVPCLDALYPKLNPGAIIVADNMLMPGGDAVRAYGLAVRAKPHMTSVLLPVGSGLEISRYEPIPAYG